MRASLGIAFVAVLHAALPARADEKPPLELETAVAFGLKTVPPGWIPVRVEARHSNPEKGAPAGGGAGERFVFRIVSGPSYDERARIISTREETIPPGAIKRFWMYAYADEDRDRLTISVRRAGSGALAAKEVVAHSLAIQDPANHYGPNPSAELRIGVLSGRNSNALSILRSLKLPNRIDAVPVALEAEDLPDRRIGYGPLDVIVLNDADLGRLTPEQTEALRAWTLGGGRLLLSPGPDPAWLAQPFFRDLLPLGRARIETRTRFDRAEVGEYVATVFETVRPAPGARSGALQEYAAGLGQVDLLAVDISGAPVRGASEDARQRFYAEVFSGYTPRGRRDDARRPWPIVVKPAVDVGPHRLLVPDVQPPVLAIAGLALAYVATIGPLNFLVLRRLERAPLIVVTIPAIAVGFVALTFGVGYAWQGGSRTYEATLVHAREGQRFGVTERLHGVVPIRALTVDHRFGRSEEGIAASTESGDAARRGFTLEQRDRIVVRGLTLARREPGVLRGESIADLEGPIRVEVAGGAVTVVNESRRDLRRVAIVTSSTFHAGKSVPAGGRVALAPGSRETAGLEERPFAGRSTLRERLYREAIRWADSRGGGFALVAEIDPDPPAADDRPAAEEQAAVLLLEP